MAQAYAVVFVAVEMWDGDRFEATRVAQKAADERFEKLAQEARKTLVTRDPEPRVMTYREIEHHFPTADPRSIVGLYFTADIK